MVLAKVLRVNAQTGSSELVSEEVVLPVMTEPGKSELVQLKEALIQKGVLSEADVLGN